MNMIGLEDVQTFIKEKPFGTALVGAGILAGVGLAVKAVVKRKKAKKRSTTRKKIAPGRKKKSKGRKLKFGSPAYRKKYLGQGKRKKGKKISPKYARTAGKGKDTSTKRIRMTKHGQPYVILANGRARFISKASAKRSRKLKGGRY